MGEQQRYWSVRDAAWLPSPGPVGPLETPWSLHARHCARSQPRSTAADDLRWLRRAGPAPAAVPDQREPSPAEAPVART